QAGFAQWLEAAQAVCDEEEPLKADVEKAYRDLNEAILALERRADFSVLQSLVSKAERYEADDYMQNEAWKTFEAALDDANDLLDNADASQKAVDDMASRLLGAMESLRRAPGKEALKALLDELDAIKPEGYTVFSYAAFRSQLALMQAVYNDAGATEAQVAEACDIGAQAKNLLQPVSTSVKTPAGGGAGRSKSYDAAGTAVAVASPVLTAAQSLAVQAYVRSDTTANFTLQRGSAYCFKMTVVNGGSAAPSFTVGDGSVLKTQLVAKLGNDYYYRVYATGAPGQSTGVYTTLPGQNAVKHCAVAIG
ncbi:hypothetical protein POG20_19960, partial [Blautia wexlerae]|nr:hypothetical protein [Blautia wexlerae]